MTTYYSIMGVASLAFYIFCFVLVVGRAKKNGALLPIDFSIIFMGIVYGASFPIVAMAMKAGYFPKYYHIFTNAAGIYALHTIGAFLSLGGLLLGWSFVKTGDAINVKRPNIYKGVFSAVRGTSHYVFAFWLMVAISFVAMFLYTLDYGGFIGATKYSALVRSAYFEYFDRSRFSFLKPFGDFTIIACYGFLGLMLARRASVGVITGFIAAFSFSLYILYLNQGRVDFLVFILINVLSIIRIWRFSPTIVASMLIVAAPSVVYLLYLISNLLNLKGSGSFSEFYSKEVSFVFVAFFAKMSDLDSSFRYFKDIAFYPAYLIPSSLTHGWIDDPSGTITKIVHGYRKGTEGVTAGMPVDIVTMGLMQLHFPGIIVYSFFYGMLVKGAYLICRSIPILAIREVFFLYVCIKLGILGLFYAQPSSVVIGNFPVIVSVIVVSSLLFVGQIGLAGAGRARG